MLADIPIIAMYLLLIVIAAWLVVSIGRVLIRLAFAAFVAPFLASPPTIRATAFLDDFTWPMRLGKPKNNRAARS